MERVEKFFNPRWREERIFQSWVERERVQNLSAPGQESTKSLDPRLRLDLRKLPCSQVMWRGNKYAKFKVWSLYFVHAPKAEHMQALIG